MRPIPLHPITNESHQVCVTEHIEVLTRVGIERLRSEVARDETAHERRRQPVQPPYSIKSVAADRLMRSRSTGSPGKSDNLFDSTFDDLPRIFAFVGDFSSALMVPASSGRHLPFSSRNKNN